MKGLPDHLRGLDLGALAGGLDLLRTVGDIREQIGVVPLSLGDLDQRLTSFHGIAGLDVSRRDLFATALGASDITEAIGLRLGRDQFVERSTLSLGMLASAQLSTPAIRALTAPAFLLPQDVLADRRRLAAYGGLAETFHEALGKLPRTALIQSPPMRGFVDTFRATLERLAGGAWRMVDLRHEIDEDAIVFVERHGWPLPLALPLGVVHRVVAMASRGKREVQRFMCDSFGPRTAAFRASKNRLLESEHFAARRQPVVQGLKALHRGEYYAAICTLLPLVEGVLVDAVLVDDPPVGAVAKKAFDEMRDIGDEVDAIVVRSVETLLVSATSGAALFSHFDRRAYGGPGETRRLNRHAILHGSARRYGTQANALRLFLLLVALAEVLDIYADDCLGLSWE